jgi:hypothetical protein
MKRSLVLLALAACTAQTSDPLAGDESTAREAINAFVARGEAAIPELKARVEDPNPVVRRRARTALGRITGQWGSDGRVLWRRSLEEAVGRGKPILVLHLFGKFDEEFC